MYSLYYKIKKRIRDSFNTKNQKLVRVQRVLVVHDNLNDNSIYIKALKLLTEDFKITFRNYFFKENIFNEIDSYDFVIVISSFKGMLHRDFISLKKSKLVSGLIVLGEKLPEKKKDTQYYDVVWFPTYTYGNKIPETVFKIHAFGIDESLKKVPAQVTIGAQILYTRLHGESLKSYNVSNHEFLKSPIWDLKYLSLQLQKGLSAFQIEKIRATNLISSSDKLKAGRFSFYNKNLLLTGDEYVTIGSFCSLGKNVSIYTSNHDTNYASTQGYIYRKFFKSNHPGENKINPSKSRTKGPVIIKNDVWIGDDVKIMSGVTIGNGACIAAGSIVTSNVGDYEIVGGIPAKVIKMRFRSQKLIEQLLKLEWWYWSDKKISSNRAFFNLDLNELDDLNTIEIK